MQSVARHTVYNVLGQAVPLVVGLAAIPIITKALGDSRFGLLLLMWAIIGYFSVLDLGLGRATTKFVAEALAGQDSARAQQVAGFTAAGQTALGILGGVVLAAVAPWLVSGVLHVPAGLTGEAVLAFRWLALSVPFVVLSLNLRAVLEGARRFDLANLIRAPNGVLAFAIPAAAAYFGAGLPEIVALLLGLRIVACWASWIAIRAALPGFRWDLRPPRDLVRTLLGYGGWVAVSNVVGPILTYLERFVLGAVAGVGAVAYFAAPYEAISRLLIVPASLAGGLLPVVSVPLGARGRAKVERLLGRSVRSLWMALGGPVVVVLLFSGPLLRLWLGPAYAAQGATAFAILAAGMLIMGLAHVPGVFLVGQGRPDLPAIFNLIELPIYVVLAWWCVRAYGVTGAALAWTLRVTLDAVLLFAAARMVGRLSLRSLLGLGVPSEVGRRGGCC
jgi:O-antigen/teichoic acid export membrane protein